MASAESFQGVVCCCLDQDTTVQDTIIKLLDLKTSSVHQDVNCFDLELKNKYYQATINLFDYDKIADDNRTNELIENCHAIIFYGNGQTLTVEQLDTRLEELTNVGGEPRILLCGGIDEECHAHRSLQDWCIKRGYDLLLTSKDGVKEQLIESLSAYKWAHRSSKPSDTSGDHRQLDGEFLKKLMDFDNLLGKLSAYRERPELRGDPDDKNIEEIAEILSGLLGDDVDNFLENDDHNETTDGTSQK